jgi:hypothetical protein
MGYQFQTVTKKHMNVSHMIGKKKNRLSRCGKRLTSKELTGEQRARIVQREAELEKELAKIK